MILGAGLHWAGKARHLVQSLRYEIRHHYMAMFIDNKAVFIRWLTMRNVESGIRRPALHTGVAEPHGLGRWVVWRVAGSL